MNPNDLIKNSRYIVPVTFQHKSAAAEYVFELQPGEKIFFRAADVIKLVHPEPPTLVGTSRHKYDPCRLFRKGDVAEVSSCKGRALIPVDLKVGDKVKVCDEEKKGDSVIYVIDHIGRRYFINPAYLELVTPVEEQEPYIVTYDDKFYHIHKQGEEASIAVYSEARHPQAKEAAEAERDRLNAAFRKERENG